MDVEEIVIEFAEIFVEEIRMSHIRALKVQNTVVSLPSNSPEQCQCYFLRRDILHCRCKILLD